MIDDSRDGTDGQNDMSLNSNKSVQFVFDKRRDRAYQDGDSDADADCFVSPPIGISHICAKQRCKAVKTLSGPFHEQWAAQTPLTSRRS